MRTWPMYSRGQNKVNVCSMYNDRATVLVFSFRASFSFIFKSFISVRLLSVSFASVYRPFSSHFRCVVLNARGVISQSFSLCSGDRMWCSPATRSSTSCFIIRRAFVVGPSFVVSLPARTSTCWSKLTLKRLRYYGYHRCTIVVRWANTNFILAPTVGLFPSLARDNWGVGWSWAALFNGWLHEHNQRIVGQSAWHHWLFLATIQMP